MRNYYTIGDWGHARINYDPKFIDYLSSLDTLTWDEATKLAADYFDARGTTRATSGYIDSAGIARVNVPYSKRVAMGIVFKAKSLGVTYIKKGK